MFYSSSATFAPATHCSCLKQWHRLPVVICFCALKKIVLWFATNSPGCFSSSSLLNSRCFVCIYCVNFPLIRHFCTGWVSYPGSSTVGFIKVVGSQPSVHHVAVCCLRGFLKPFVFLEGPIKYKVSFTRVFWSRQQHSYKYKKQNNQYNVFKYRNHAKANKQVVNIKLSLYQCFAPKQRSEYPFLKFLNQFFAHVCIKMLRIMTFFLSLSIRSETENVINVVRYDEMVL